MSKLFNMNDGRSRGAKRGAEKAQMMSRESYSTVTLPTLGIYDYQPVIYSKGELWVGDKLVSVRKP